MLGCKKNFVQVLLFYDLLDLVQRKGIGCIGFIQEIGDLLAQQEADSLKVGEVEAPLPQFIVGKRCLSAPDLFCQLFLTKTCFFAGFLKFFADFFVCIHNGPLSSETGIINPSPFRGCLKI